MRVPFDPASSAADAGVRRFGERCLCALILGIPAVYAALLVVAWNHVGPRDFDQFVVFHELQLWNWQLFGFAKQWSPVLCSGVSLAGEPQVPSSSLSMLITYALGPLRGLQLASVIYFACGWLGAYLYAGLWLAGSRTRALAASLFIGNGFFVCRLAYGHMDFIPFLTLPLLLWALHRALGASPSGSRAARTRLPLITLAMAAGIALIVDGSPVAIVHLLFWVGLYAVTLAVAARSPQPVVVFSLAAFAAVLLDAGYLWPMLTAQADFPRRTAESFTNPLALLWFMLLPVRGKLIEPATGNGHELSVFIGPVLAYAIWRFRAALLRTLPATLVWPLLVVSVASVGLGMGSLHALGLPIWSSPFDWLRPLPGFRSLLVTGRFWGFLSLPLSLLGAAALRQLVTEQPWRRMRLWLVLALLLQLGFQIVTLAQLWRSGHPYVPIDARAAFSPGGESIEYVRREPPHYQGEFITPRRGVVDCYDNDEFIRFQLPPGSPLIDAIQDPRGAPLDAAAITGRFVTWSHVHLDVAPARLVVAGLDPSFRVVLNQAYSRHWRAPGCATSRDDAGKLVLTCAPGELGASGIDLDFDEPVSRVGVRVGAGAWLIWAVALSTLLWKRIRAGGEAS